MTFAISGIKFLVLNFTIVGVNILGFPGTISFLMSNLIILSDCKSSIFILKCSLRLHDIIRFMMIQQLSRIDFENPLFLNDVFSVK